MKKYNHSAKNNENDFLSSLIRLYEKNQQQSTKGSSDGGAKWGEYTVSRVEFILTQKPILNDGKGVY